MGYIIVWRNTCRDPFIMLNDHSFKEEYSSYEDAEKDAKSAQDNELFLDYAIFEEVTS